MLLYTDIFQVTDSTLRTARRLAAAGFVVCVPEIYPRGALAGVALEFDDAGKQAGLAGAAGTTTAQFDADRAAVLDFMEQRADITTLLGGGVLHRRSPRVPGRLRPRVAATVCFYPTGLHNGALGADADAGSLAGAGSIRGGLMIVFGSQDPHVPADARVQVVSALYAAGLDDLELHVYSRRRARVHARRRRSARPGAHRSRAGRGGLLPPGPVTRPVGPDPAGLTKGLIPGR